MASASTLGHIAFWDLEKRQLGTVLHDAHEGTVSGMKFLPSEPLLVTNGPDNSLKVMILLQQDFFFFFFKATCWIISCISHVVFCLWEYIVMCPFVRFGYLISQMGVDGFCGHVRVTVLLQLKYATMAQKGKIF